MEHSLSDFMILLAIIDPMGTLAVFVGLTADRTPPERRKIAIRSILFAGIVLIAFLIAGQLVLSGLGIQMGAFRVAGGIILFLFGLQMIFGTGIASAAAMGTAHDVAIFPLALPTIASPGALLAVVVLTDNTRFSVPEQAITGAILVVVLFITMAILLQANRIHRIIGQAGASILIRVFGLILAALAVEMALEGIQVFYGLEGGVKTKW